MLALALVGLVALAVGEAPLAARPPEPQPIVGGALVPPGAYPDAVAILTPLDHCTGTLIAPTVVLTAAHCFDLAPLPEKVRVLVGDDIFAPAWQSSAASYVNHPMYCPMCASKWDWYDLAVVILRDPAPVAPIRVLADQDEWDEAMEIDDPVTLVGYGNDDDEFAGYKREVAVKIRSQSPSYLEFFAGGDGRDSCQGDSGGPAYATGKGGERILVGVLSRGYECGTGGFYFNAHAALCWASEASGVDLRAPECGDCQCIEYEPGCSRCQQSPRGGDALSLAIPLAIAAWRRRRRGSSPDRPTAPGASAWK